MLVSPSIMNKHISANFTNVIEPGGVIGLHINTAMTYGNSKIVVPVYAMDGVTLMKEHDIRHIR